MIADATLFGVLLMSSTQSSVAEHILLHLYLSSLVISKELRSLCITSYAFVT